MANAVRVDGPTHKKASFGGYWTARLTWPDGLTHNVTAPEREAVQRLIDRLVGGDFPGGV
jgi:hypothetical protein